MIIENVEALREWLTKYLEPLCDADPVALAKYVMALIKKDRPEKELKTVCMDQLEVFLQQKTITFVDTLFETIGDKSYLKDANNSTTTPSTTPSTQTSKTSTQTSLSEQTPVSTTVSETSSSVPTKSPEIGSNNNNNNKPSEQPVPNSQTNVNIVKTEATQESSNKPKDAKRNRSRSRSRSPIRNRRGDFDSRRLGPNPNRNGAYYNEDRRNRRGVSNRRPGHQRYGGYRNDRNERDYRRPRDLKRGRSRSRSRGSYTSESSRSRSRSRSRSWSKELPNERRDRESPSNKKSRPSSRPTSRSPSPSKLTKEEKSKKCRDYEEKGFCLKGHLCPYDHGNDPVVLDSNVSAALFNSNNPGPNPPIMPIPNAGIGPNAPNSYLAEPYNPEAPGMDAQRPRPPPGPPLGPRMPPPPYGWGPIHIRGPLPGHPLPPPQFMPPPGRPRELIGVPTIDNNLRHSQSHTNRTVIDPNIQMGMRGGIRGMKHMGRGGYRNVRRVPNDSADKTCLEVRKIPPNLNTISHLNEHFSKFGTIVNLQVKHEGDPEAALVQFTTHSEALSAIRNTEAVLNNRFIKVFWHSKELQQKHEQIVGVKPEEQTDESETGGSKMSIKDRLGPKIGETGTVVTALNSSGTISRTVFDPSKLKKNNMNNQSKDKTNNENNSQTIPETTNSSVVKSSPKSDKNKNKEIMEQHMKLLKEMFLQQKLLTTKWEKSTTESEKKEIKEMIDSTLDRIQKESDLIKELSKKTTTKKKQTNEELKAEILNTDLDLFIKLQNKDLSYLNEAEKLVKLKKQKMAVIRGRGAKMYGRRSHGMRRGSFYGRGANPLLKVDRRTRKLLIPDINEDDITDLLEHLAQFSDVEVIEPSSNGAVVTFKTRMDAEKAIQNISQIKFKEDSQLNYSWFDENLTKSLNKNELNKAMTDDKGIGLTDDHKVDSFGVEEEILDFEEDDTEDESEARNWKA